MRVLVCSDHLGSLTSAAAGRAIAAGWSFAEVATRPAGEAGACFVEAMAERLGAELSTTVVQGRLATFVVGSSACAVALPGEAGHGSGQIPYGASSLTLGESVREAIGGSRPTTLYVDLAGTDVHDGGAGFLAGLGAAADSDLTAGVSGLADVSAVDLAAPRALLDGIELVGVVPADSRKQALLGLRGITAARGQANDDDPARLLATDAALAAWAELIAPGRSDIAGAGACGGLGLAVLALGGRLTTGPEIAVEDVVGSYDLVVTGCGVFDFASRGGGVVATAASLAGRLLCPCVVIAGEVLIGGREMRTLGVEAAYAVRESTRDRPTAGDIGADELTRVAARVARSWRW